MKKHLVVYVKNCLPYIVVLGLITIAQVILHLNEALTDKFGETFCDLVWVVGCVIIALVAAKDYFFSLTAIISGNLSESKNSSKQTATAAFFSHHRQDTSHSKQNTILTNGILVILIILVMHLFEFAIELFDSETSYHLASPFFLSLFAVFSICGALLIESYVQFRKLPNHKFYTNPIFYITIIMLLSIGIATKFKFLEVVSVQIDSGEYIVPFTFHIFDNIFSSVAVLLYPISKTYEFIMKGEK